MKNQMRTLFCASLFTMAFSLNSHAEGGWISGGGDPLRFYFLEGQELASEWILNLDDKQLPTSFPDVTAWILIHRAEIADDVMKSQQNWTTSSQVTCGLTQFHRDAEIQLSVTSCRSISTAEEAAKMLLHETVHHFGIKEEAFADRVAMAIATAWEFTKLTQIPNCATRDDRLAKGIAGEWIVDAKLTRKLGGTLMMGPKGVLTLQEEFSEKSKFQGFGHCALSAGKLTLETIRGKRVFPYLLVDYRGTPHLVTLKPARETAPPARPIRRRKLPGIHPGIQPWTLQLIRAQEAARDILLLGESDSEEALTAFERK